MKLTFVAEVVTEDEMNVLTTVSALMDEDRLLAVNPDDIFGLIAHLDNYLPTIINSKCGVGIDGPPDGPHGWRQVAADLRYLADQIEKVIAKGDE
jgi:hypothetical protein